MLEVFFPGGKCVDAGIQGMLIKTDQSITNGGTESAPEPFQLFLASIATCAGIYALEFCQARNISTDGISLKMSGIRDEDLRRFTKFTITLQLPKEFPEKYRNSIIRSMNLCAVKKHIIDPPEFEMAAIFG